MFQSYKRSGEFPISYFFLFILTNDITHFFLFQLFTIKMIGFLDERENTLNCICQILLFDFFKFCSYVKIFITFLDNYQDYFVNYILKILCFLILKYKKKYTFHTDLREKICTNAICPSLIFALSSGHQNISSIYIL